jgi:hypothetical protein
MDDVRKVTYVTLTVFVVGVVGWITFLFIVGCGFSTACPRGVSLSIGDRTPIPTLIPATLPASARNAEVQLPSTCEVAAIDLIGAWVAAGFPEADGFRFAGTDARACMGTFGEDVQPLFIEADLWNPGSLACAACHGSDLAASPGHIDLGTYAGIVAGSQPTEPDGEGIDILAGGDWSASVLYRTLAPGHPPGAAAGGPAIFAGAPLTGESAQAASTPTP